MSPGIFRFADFELDCGAYELRRNGQTLKLERIPLNLLFLLIDRRGTLVTREEIRERIWRRQVFFDVDNSINSAMRKIRRALGDDSDSPRFVVTVPTKGYRFAARVTLAVGPNEPAELTKVVQKPATIIVGREIELAQLDNWYARAVAGERQIVFLAGEAGIGKSTLLSAFLDHLAGGPARIARGQCIQQYGEGEPYMPMLEALTRICQKKDGRRVIELLRQCAPSWLAQMPSLLSVADQEWLKSTTAGVTQYRMLREMAQAFEAIATETPLVVALEDLHWSDFSTLELISAIARRSEPAQLLVLATYRPTEMLTRDHPLRAVKQELQLHGDCEELRVKLLGEQEVADYLKRRFAGTASPLNGTAPFVYQQTDGNPLFMVQLVNHLVASAAVNADKIETPHSIVQMIERNLERLNPDDRRILEAASVAGREFSAAAVAAALQSEASAIEVACTQLARREQFVSPHGFSEWPDGTVASCFRFHHGLYNEVLCERIAAGLRVAFHRRIAERGERAYGKGAGEIAAELAHHFDLANDRKKSIEYHRLAGERAVARCAMVEAEYHYRTALKLLSGLPETSQRDRTELALLLAAGPALMAPKGWAAPEVESAYIRGRELSQRLGKGKPYLAFLYGLWVNHLERLEFRSAYAIAKELLLRAEGTGDSTLLLQGCQALGVTAHRMGRFELAREYLEKALSLCGDRRMRPLGVDMEVVCRSQLAWTLGFLGLSDRAIGMSKESIALAHALSDPFSLHFAQVFMCYLQQQRRDVLALERNADQTISLCTEHGFAYGLAHASLLRGVALTEQGRPAEGLQQIQEAFPRIAAAGAEVNRAEFLYWLAEAHYLNGHTDLALEILSKAAMVADEHENRWQEVEIQRLRGEVLLRRRESNSAVRIQFDKAIETARRQGAKALELRVTISLARLLIKQGLRGEAHARLSEIHDWFAEGFDTVDLKEAKVLLKDIIDRRAHTGPQD